MQNYSDMQRIMQRGSEFEYKYYKDMNMKKMFNATDQNLAYRKYSEKYNVNPAYLTPDQKLVAENEYKQEKGIFLQGANTYSQFLYENYYGTDLFPIQKTQELKEETKSFKTKINKVLTEVSELLPTTMLKKETRNEFFDFVKTRILDDGKYNFADLAETVFWGMSEYVGNIPIGEAQEEVWQGILRGAVGLVGRAGEMMTEGYEQRNYNAQSRVDLYNDNEDLQNDIERLRELKGPYTQYKSALYSYKESNKDYVEGYSPQKGTEPNILDYMTQEEANEYEKLNAKKYKGFTVGNISTKVATDQKFLNREIHPLKVLGESLELISNVMIESDTLNSAYSKDYREGKIQYDEWFNKKIFGKNISFPQSLKDPRYWTNQAPEVVGEVAVLMGLMALTPGLPDEYAMAGYVINGLPINIMYSASEANQVRTEAREMGYSEEKINEMTDTAFRQNIVVQGVLGAAPGAVTKMMNRIPAFQALANTNWATRITSRVTTVGVDAMFEGIEEVLQDEIRNAQLQKDYVPLAQISGETFIMGFIGGLFGGGGVLFQDTAFNKSYQDLLEDKALGPMTKELTKNNIADGQTKQEAQDNAMSDMIEITKGTTQGQEIIERENKRINESLIQQVIKPIKDMQNQEKQRSFEQLKKMSTEERHSQIEGFKFSHDKTDGNIRILEGPAITSQVDDNTAIANMVTQQMVKKYNDITYDEKTNTYKSKVRITRFAKEVQDKTNQLKKLNELVKNIDESKDVSAVRGHMKEYGLSNNSIHDMYDNNAMTTPQYINTVRKMHLKARESQLNKNIEYGENINDMVNNLVKLDAQSYNELKQQLIKDFGTEAKAIKTLTEIGAITANDGATFRNHSKTLEQQAKDTTKKDLETATKTVETQQEANKQLKESNKELKTQNKQMKMDLADEVVPQRVKTVKQIKKDKTIGKTVEQQKVIKIQEKVQTEKMEQLNKEIGKVLKEDTKPQITIKMKSPLVKALESRGVKVQNVVKAEALNIDTTTNGEFGKGFYLNKFSAKVGDFKIETKQFIDLDKYNMYRPKNKGELQNITNMMKQVKELNRVNNGLESEFDAETLKTEIMEFGSELGFNSTPLTHALENNLNPLEHLGYDGVDLRKFQKGEVNQTVIFKDIKDNIIQGRDIVNEQNEIKETIEIKKGITKPYC